MANNKVVLSNGTTIIDLTDATATADKILSPYTAYGADGTKLVGTASGGGTQLIEKSGSFTVSSDYSYTRSAISSYTGSVLINTGLTDIAIICVWDEAWADQTGQRPRFGAFFWTSLTFLGSDVPPLQDTATSPYHYGSGNAMNATTSTWYGASLNSGPVTNEMTSTVPKGQFGIKTHSNTYPIKAGATIRWKAWGYN